MEEAEALGSPRPPPCGITSLEFEVTCLLTMPQAWLLWGLLTPNPDPSCKRRLPPAGACTEAGRPGEARGSVSDGTGPCTFPLDWLHLPPSAWAPQAGVRALPNLCAIDTSDVHRDLFFLRHPPDCSRPWAGPAGGGGGGCSGWGSGGSFLLSGGRDLQ